MIVSFSEYTGHLESQKFLNNNHNWSQHPSTLDDTLKAIVSFMQMIAVLCG